MMEKRFDLLISGYVSMDRIIKIDAPARIGFTSIIANKDNASIKYGGCSVNIACAVSKLGLKAAPLIRVGGDYVDNGFKDFLESVGTPLDGLTVLPEETTSCCYLVENENKDHITLFYPGAMDAKYSAPLNDELFQQSKMAVLTVGSLPDNLEFFSKCLKYDVPLIFGMKSDPDAFPPELLKKILMISDVIFTNEAEAAAIRNEFGLDSMKDFFRIGRARIIVTTSGSRGSRYYQKDGNSYFSGMIPAYTKAPVIDTTGAGDAFISGFLYAMLKGFSAEDCCKAGSALSSFVLEKEGCLTNIPDVDQFNARFEEMKKEN